MTPTPANGKTIAPPVSRVDKAPETATKLLMRIAVATEMSERHLAWISLPIKIAFGLGGAFIVFAMLGLLFSGVMQFFDRR